MPEFKESNLIFGQLPQEQLGVIVAYNFFDNLSMNMTQRMLRETFNLLKPGGKMIFTFNDCDLPHNITLVERKFKYYTPGRLVKHHLENIGYTIIKQFRETYGMAWFEVEKPGQIERIKGSQTLAQPKRK
jgi:SAM-dependent methyltransferase